MLSELRPALMSLAAFSIITGVAYPLLVTGISSTVFASQSHGSLVVQNGTARGSALVGQAFTKPGYLWSRPSAIAIPYDARGSSGSNLGPTNPLLDSLVKARVAAARAANPAADSAVPVELVTASGSGLDPNLSPAAARWQVPRIAAARQLDTAAVQRVIDANTEQRTFGVLGEPRVNVLQVNLQLDSLSSLKR